MKRNTPARLTASLLAALLLLLQLAPSSAQAQQRRRRRRAVAPPAPTRPARTNAPSRTERTNTPQRSSDPAPRAEATPAPSQQRRGREAPVESLLSADAYGVFAEVRKVGRLAQDPELKTALAALRLTGEMPREYNDLVAFVMEHAEALGEARYVMTMMPARPGVPLGLSVLEFPTVESAVAFEPKYRSFVNRQLKEYKDAEAAAAEAATPPSRRRGGRRAAPPSDGPKPFQFKVTQRRVGNCLIIGTEPFTLKRLKGDGTNLLADSVRFQSMRGRFASEPLFIYVDTEAVQRGWKTQMELAQKQAEEMQAAQAAQEEAASGPVEAESATTRDISVIAPVVTDTTTPVVRSGVVGEPIETTIPPTGVNPDAGLSTATLSPEEEAAEGEEGTMPPAPPKPSESEMASSQLSSVLRGVWNGIPRIPETFALAVSLEGGTVSLRLAVANTPDGAVNLIPFLPNVFNGPAISSDGAALAPADADVFITTSLDWSRIFGALVATAEGTTARMHVVTGDDSGAMLGDPGEGVKSAEEAKPLMPEAVIESVEKLFGFKFKEDLLPSLGNEVAFSVPLSYFTSGRRPRQTTAEEAKGEGEKAGKDEKEKDAEAGLVVIVSLNDPEKLRKILPRVAMAFGFASPSTPLSAEKREGFEIQKLGAFSYVIINNHLAIAEDVKAVRHVVDAYTRRQTLEATNGFRDATAWQARQRIAQVFVSEGLMKYTQDETKKTARASSDPLVLALLTQLDMTPEPASYAATNEGDVVLHEARLPLGLIKTYAASIMIGVKEAPIRSNESMAQYALSAVASAQLRFKHELQKQRFGTLEELIAADLIEKWVLERQEYKLEVSVVGDKFEATATPNEYGKTGRRSFFVDETSLIRAADHKGKPATAQDPPVD